MTYEARIPQYSPWAEIDCQAITHNHAWLVQRMHRAGLRAPVRIWAVVKADAYGHGLLNAVCALNQADGLCVGSMPDVIRLRAAGWEKPILLLSAYGLSASALCNPALGDLHLVVDDASQLRLLEGLEPHKTAIHAWLRYAGRLGNQGLEQPAYGAAYEGLMALQQAGKILQAGHLHHYAAAENPQQLDQERQEFSHCIGHLPGPRSTGNSAALCSELPESIHQQGHWLRCGLLLYGVSALPGLSGSDLGLRPAMSLRARILAVRRIRADQTVGYGDGFRAKRDTCIGTVGIGYSHGLPRCFGRTGQVLVNRTSRAVPLAGRVAMDSLTIDLGPEAQEQPGDVVTLWGSAENGMLQPVETVAASCDTIAAELLSGLTARVPLISRSPNQCLAG